MASLFSCASCLILAVIFAQVALATAAAPRKLLLDSPPDMQTQVGTTSYGKFRIYRRAIAEDVAIAHALPEEPAYTSSIAGGEGDGTTPQARSTTLDSNEAGERGSFRFLYGRFRPHSLLNGNPCLLYISRIFANDGTSGADKEDLAIARTNN